MLFKQHHIYTVILFYFLNATWKSVKAISCLHSIQNKDVNKYIAVKEHCIWN